MPTPAALALPKCPEHLTNWVVQDSADGFLVEQAVSQIPLAGELAAVPEVQDCQRLVVPGEDAYGPLGVLFVSEALPALFDGRAAEGVEPNAAAVLYSWPEGYPPLRMAAGWNCLYIIRRSTGAGAAYRAFVIPADYDTDPPAICDKPLRKFDPGQALDVHFTPIDGTSRTGAADLMLVAGRWEEGPRRRGQHVSLRCGTGWCDVLPTTDPEAAPTMLPDGVPADAQSALKGWYDQQRLAIPDPAKPGVLIPGGPVGTYVPATRLTRYSLGEFGTEWRTTGWIHLDRASDHYAEKLNLAHGWNEVALRQLGPDESPDGAPVHACKTPAAAGTTASWWVRITPEGGTPHYYCATRYEHVPALTNVPGIVRWRWLDEDETTWQRCSAGCCPIS